MGDVSDETLMVFADCELTESERAPIEAALARNPELRGRLAVFEPTRPAIFPKIPGPLNEPVPQHLIDLVMNSAVAGYEKRPAAIRSAGLWDKITSAFTYSIPSFPTALAYSAAILIGTGVGAYFARQWAVEGKPAIPLVAFDDGVLVASGQLAQLLETKPSGKDVVVDDASGRQASAKLRLRLTFKNQEDNFCRRYDLVPASGDGVSALACRDENGRWRLLAHVATAHVYSPGNGNKPAGKEDAARMVDETGDKMRVGDALGLDEETAAISNRWRR